MATQFSFTQATQGRVQIEVDGSPMVLNQLYDISLQNTVKFINITGFRGQPLDQCKYRITDNATTSINEGTVDIEFPVVESPQAPPVTIVKDILLNQSFLFSDEVDYDSSFDRIVVTNITGKGKWLLNGVPVGTGAVIFFYELFSNLTFISDDEGAKPSYSILDFDFASATSQFSGSSIKVNTTSMAELYSDDDDGDSEDEIDPGDPNRVIERTLWIEKSFDSGTFKIFIDTTNFPGIGTGENKVVIDFNGSQMMISGSGSFPYTGSLGPDGRASLDVTITTNNPYATDGSVDFSLSLINGANTYISGTNTASIFIPST